MTRLGGVTFDDALDAAVGMGGTEPGESPTAVKQEPWTS